MITIIDYDAGNTCSVMNALKRLDIDFLLTDDASKIRASDKVIFPGVGHAGSAMEALKKKNLVQTIIDLKQPVLGICVGMQLLCKRSEEGDAACLGILEEEVLRFKPDRDSKVPHMGWNSLQVKSSDKFLQAVEDGDYFYFVHSYYVPECAYTLATCHHQLEFSAVIKKDNFYGIQFHAEKSGPAGEKLLKTFIENT